MKGECECSNKLKTIQPVQTWRLDSLDLALGSSKCPNPLACTASITSFNLDLSTGPSTMLFPTLITWLPPIATSVTDSVSPG